MDKSIELLRCAIWDLATIEALDRQAPARLSAIRFELEELLADRLNVPGDRIRIQALEDLYRAGAAVRFAAEVGRRRLGEDLAELPLIIAEDRGVIGAFLQALDRVEHAESFELEELTA